MEILRGILGLAVVMLLALLASSHRKSINWRLVIIGLVMQVVFAFLVVRTTVGREIFSWISARFVQLFGFATEGAVFVFGNLGKADNSVGFIFAFQVLPTIIFFASFMAVLYHLGVMQWVVRGFAWVMARLLNTSGAESLDVAANTFIGQTEAPLVIRPYLGGLTQSELYTIMTSGMAHIAGGVLAAYVQMLAVALSAAQNGPLDQAQVFFAGHLLAASIMAGPATMVIAKMILPEREQSQTMGSVNVHTERTYGSVIEAAAGGAGDGLRLALNVAGMLVAFIALIALLNAVLGWAGDLSGLNGICQAQFGKPLSLELLFGLVFQFMAFIIGVPWSEALPVGSLMGIKLVLNEFVAYLRLASEITAGHLSPRSIVIATYALAGFANFSSIAIQIGGLSPLAEHRRADIARLGIKAVIGGTLATWMTASIAGLLV